MTILDGVNGTVCNAQQYRQSRHPYGNRSSTVLCLTHGDIVGLTLMAEASLISSISIVVIFIWIGWNVRWHRRMFPNGNWKLFRGPADIYMFSLFTFDLLHATGGILNIRWAHNGTVTTGQYCAAQALVRQIGALGVALNTLFLAVHTFVAAVWKVGLRARGVAVGLVCLACVFVSLWIAIPTGIHKNYGMPIISGCWIDPGTVVERLGSSIWVWITLLASVILYIPLYFWAEGFWSVDEESRFHWSKPDQRVEYAERRATLGMLLYPLAYALVVLPLTVTAGVLAAHHHVSSAVSFFGGTIFYLSGGINVILFLIIRPELLLFSRREEVTEHEIELACESQGTGSGILSNAVRSQNRPEPTSMDRGDKGSRDGAQVSRVGSGRTSDDI